MLISPWLLCLLKIKIFLGVSHEELANNQVQQAAMSNLNQEVVNAALKAFWSVAGGGASSSGQLANPPLPAVPNEGGGNPTNIWR